MAEEISIFLVPGAGVSKVAASDCKRMKHEGEVRERYLPSERRETKERLGQTLSFRVSFEDLSVSKLEISSDISGMKLGACDSSLAPSASFEETATDELGVSG